MEPPPGGYHVIVRAAGVVEVGVGRWALPYECEPDPCPGHTRSHSSRQVWGWGWSWTALPGGCFPRGWFYIFRQMGFSW